MPDDQQSTANTSADRVSENGVPLTTEALPPIGPCAECGVEIAYGESYVIGRDMKRRHAVCETTGPTNPIVQKVVERVALAIVRAYTRDDRRQVNNRDREVARQAITALAADMGGVWVVERLTSAAMDYSADLQGDRSGMGLRTAYAVRDACDVLNAVAAVAKEPGHG